MQSSLKVFVNASNCMSGGGRTLLKGLLKGVAFYPQYEFVVFIDARFETTIAESNLTYIRIAKKDRYKVAFIIRKQLKPNDIIFYFGNLPPLISFPGHRVFLLQSNRFMIEKYSLKGFSPKRKIAIILERAYFNFFYKNVTDIIVQTSSMLSQVKKLKRKIPAYIMPSYDLAEFASEQIVSNRAKIPGTFLYVASLYPYKNHERLLRAWKKLSDEGLSPRLSITVDDENALTKWIENYIQENSLNVRMLRKLPREALLKVYEESEVLIFPSLYESYGLPLVEAKAYNMKVIASDLDFSWDLIDPDDYFNPYDENAIARAIARHLKQPRVKDCILDPKTFLASFFAINQVVI